MMPSVQQFRAFALVAAASAGVGAVAISPAAACGPDSYVGSLCATAGTYCPQNTLPADGNILPTSEFQVLYAVIGNVYGGQAPYEFALPDLRGRSVVGAGYGPGLAPVPLGQQRGAEEVRLGIAQLPSHSHLAVFTATPDGPTELFASTAAGQSASPTADYNQLASATSPAAAIYGAATLENAVPIAGLVGGDAGGGSVTVEPNGDGVPFQILPPQAALTYCIVYQGYFPPRPN